MGINHTFYTFQIYIKPNKYVLFDRSYTHARYLLDKVLYFSFILIFGKLSLLGSVTL